MARVWKSLSLAATILAAATPNPSNAQAASSSRPLSNLDQFGSHRPKLVTDSGHDPILIYTDGIRAKGVKVRANQLIVSFYKLSDEAARDRLTHIPGLAVLDAVPGRAVFLVRLSPQLSLTPLSPQQAAAALGLDGEIAAGNIVVDAPILFAAADNQSGIYPYEFEPWHFLNLGRTATAQINDADVDAEEALGRLASGTLPQPSRSPTVAIIDSGINPIHPALKAALWANPREIPGNGRDDDGNGYKDDINGWNFTNNDNHLQDTNIDGHGTHVAGIIAARPTSSTAGPQGIAPMARLVIAKVVFRPDKQADPFPILKAVYYATALKVDVINMSLKVDDHIQAFKDAIYAASLANIAVVAAAGNDGSDNGQTPVYPCAYEYMVLCVAATDARDRLASFSNYSPGLRMIAAPGVDIYSTLPSGSGYLSGTSMAAPLVSGAIAGMRSLYPDMTVAELQGRLLETADQPVGLVGKLGTPKRLNLYRAYFAPLASYGPADDGYCDQRISAPQSPQQTYPRWNNWPYANSGEPGIDGASAERAFTICTARQLVSIQRGDLAKVFVLRRHIDWLSMAPASRQQIGAEVTSAGTRIYPFQGILNGNGFEIRSLTQLGGPTGGLFGELGSQAVVFNLRFTDAHVEFRQGGGILATKSSGHILNVHASGTVRGQLVVGGLVGQQIGGGVENSFVDASVNGDALVGGLVGVLGQTFVQPGAPPAFGMIATSRFQGRIAGAQAGGIVGWANNGLIRQTYAHVENDDTTAATVGGLVGQLTCGARLQDSYSEARLRGAREIGGIVGLLVSGRISSSFTAAFVSGGAAGKVGSAIGVRDDRRTNSIDSTPPLFFCTATTSPGPDSTIEAVAYNSSFSDAPGGGGRGLTNTQMRTPASFPGFSPTLWELKNGRYPILKDLPRSSRSDE